MERALADEYRAHMERALGRLANGNSRALENAFAVSEAAEQIRGYGHVKLGGLARARETWKALA